MNSIEPIVVGVDVSPLRVGVGVVEFESGKALEAFMVRVRLPERGWVASGLFDLVEADPVVVGIEMPALPPRSGTMSAFKAGRAFQVAYREVQARWPGVEVVELNPQEWRKASGVGGHASKGDVRARAEELLGVELTQDAADALLVAVAARAKTIEAWETHAGRETKNV